MERSKLNEINTATVNWSLPEIDTLEKPIPLTTFLFKIASRCNLDCDYCYVYHSSDTSWKRKPKFISKEVIDQGLFRIFEHAKANRLSEVTIILHGGEPLLAGLDLIEYIFESATNLSKDICKVELGIQTNAVLLDEKTIEIFDKYGAAVGVSFDGNKEATDKHRVYRNRKSTFTAVEKAVSLLKISEAGRRIFAGFLSVIDVENDPIEVYKYLASHNPKNIDFLLPDATHDIYPPHKKNFTDTPYADWLIKIFDYWFNLPENSTRIKYFSNLISLIVGGKSETESLGISPVNIIIIEANGELEGVDTLKVAFEGAPALNNNIFNTSFDEILNNPAILTRMQGVKSLAKVCQVCPLVDICGAGYIPHRYSNTNGFNNPTVYCHDIAKLIMHIRKSVKSSLNN